MNTPRMSAGMLRGNQCPATKGIETPWAWVALQVRLGEETNAPLRRGLKHQPLGEVKGAHQPEETNAPLRRGLKPEASACEWRAGHGRKPMPRYEGD